MPDETVREAARKHAAEKWIEHFNTEQLRADSIEDFVAGAEWMLAQRQAEEQARLDGLKAVMENHGLGPVQRVEVATGYVGPERREGSRVIP